ncbi:DUF3817 domain-containing protein [Luteolibacter ambystomatis]|uniref:DUF3817 domain-containing protein n=1 Tax=Luteolibacter ambystomatis TaxID=2824561 RepID=A0A975J1J7_9BACT|nr:DUF3817 domain-containing protein [Luteolibacter ambystomatis]QUE52336.1 DUF3817 domain-containing protein [Luteolibacter ambystomatis]
MNSSGFSGPIGRLRLIGMAEGVSFLFLLGVAMPLKYAAHMPQFVKYGGWCHGLLFILLLLAIFQAWGDKLLTARQAAMTFIAALLPFGPFLIDRRLKALEPSAGEGA